MMNLLLVVLSFRVTWYPSFTGVTGVTGTSFPITMSGEYVHLSVLHRQRRDEKSGRSYTTSPFTTGQAQVYNNIFATIILPN